MVTKDKGAPPTGGSEPERVPTVEERIEELRRKKKAALTPGGRDSAKKQHDRGKLTVTTKGFNADGKEFTSTFVYEKQ